MISWLKERCFTHLEEERQKNHLLLFVIVVTYTIAEVNVLQNNPFWSRENFIFSGSCFIIFALGFWLIRYERFVPVYKYVMMTLLMLHTMNQVYIFNTLPEVYQVTYFNLALSLIYLNGRLTLFVGGISVIFTIIGRLLFHEHLFPLLDIQTFNIPVGLMIETTLVSWAVTKIGTSYSIILDKKNEISKLLQENKLQLQIIEGQKKALEEYASQVEALTLKEERNRIATELQDTLGRNLNSTVFELEMVKAKLRQPDEAETRLNQLIGSINGLREAYRGMYRQLFVNRESEHLIREIDAMVEYYRASIGENVTVKLNFAGNPVDIFQPYEYIILRAIQDALISALTHETAQMDIHLELTPEHIHLVIRDDGWKECLQNRVNSGMNELIERVKSVQGQIEIVGFKDKGRVLSIKLPQQKVHEEKIHIMLVDPDKFVRDSLEMILSDEKDLSILASVGNGRQVVQLCTRERPDIIVMEIQLEETDSIEMIKNLKRNWPNMKVIVLTNSLDVRSVVGAINAGADAYLLKSTSSRHLAMSCRYLMNGGNLMSQETTKLLANQIANHEKLAWLERRLYSQETIKEYGLKEKELQILELLAKGFKYKEIASVLYLTEGTVRNYISGIYSKLNVQERNQALQKALQLGLLNDKK